jgi:hypothetical protein
MNNIDIKYFAVFGLVMLFFLWFYFQVNQHETIYISEIACIVNNTCPDKWKDENVELNTFRKMLQVAHFLNAKFKVSEDLNVINLEVNFVKSNKMYYFVFKVIRDKGFYQFDSYDNVEYFLKFINDINSNEICLKSFS